MSRVLKSSHHIAPAIKQFLVEKTETLSLEDYVEICFRQATTEYRGSSYQQDTSLG